MKIYSALIRITIFVTALGLLVFGGLFSYQNWTGGGMLLSGGAFLACIMIIDWTRSQRRNA